MHNTQHRHKHTHTHTHTHKWRFKQIMSLEKIMRARAHVVRRNERMQTRGVPILEVSLSDFSISSPLAEFSSGDADLGCFRDMPFANACRRSSNCCRSPYGATTMYNSGVCVCVCVCVCVFVCVPVSKKCHTNITFFFFTVIAFDTPFSIVL